MGDDHDDELVWQTSQEEATLSRIYSAAGPII
jgi:hypothetical protein